MARLAALLKCVQLGVLLSSPVVYGQADNTVEWTIGTKIRLFGVDTSTACPAGLQDAQSDALSFTPVLASTNTTYSAQDGSTSNSAADLASTFYITNGLLPRDSPFTHDTSIRVAEPAGTGGGCWDTSSGSTVQVGPCNLEKNQTFYVALDGASPFTIFTSSLHALDRPNTTGDALIFSPSTQSGFCAYADDTGKLVVPPTKTPLYYPQAQVTNLTSSSFGSTLPTSDLEIPECIFAISGNGSMLESLGSVDCIVARAFATMPSGCDANPANKTCILHLWSAFCLDLPEVRNGLNASDAVDVCVRKISQGPCVANPSGAACTSGLFAGIQYVQGVQGGGSGSASSKRQASNDPLFGNRELSIPLEDQFWIGVMKNLINQGIGVFRMLATPRLEELRVTCMGMSQLSSVFEASLGKTIRDGCQNAFNTFDSMHELTYDNDIEKAGGVFADVVSLLSVAGDVARAARAVGAVDQIMARFGKVTATIGEGKGLMLEAKEGENMVQIFRDGGDGKPKLLDTDTDVAAMEKSIEEVGFENCKACVEVGGAKLMRRQRGILRKLCCFLSPQTLDSPEGTPHIIPPAQRTIAALSSSAGITAEDTKLITTMSEGFAKWYREGQSVSANADEVSSLLVEVMKDESQVGKVAMATRNLYGLIPEQTAALRAWVEFFAIWPALEPGLAKLPSTTGLVVRSTYLEPSTVKILNGLKPGQFSKGPPGIYEVRDLVLNRKSYPIDPSVRLRKIMTTTLDLGSDMFATNDDYFFIINSKSGKFISAPASTRYRETSFVQGLAGKFKLIGRQELNGGEAAKAAGKPGPYAVYYFDEIDAPAASSTVTLADLKKALADHGVSLPGTSAKRVVDVLT